jgi:Zn-dependent protease with chaperone function
MKRQFAFATVSLLALAFAPPALAEPDLYLVESLATESDHAPMRAQARELEAIYQDLAREAGVEAQLVWSTDPDLNAFATEVGEEKIVVVQEGLLTKFASDRDAVAAVLGHELAHHKADHIRAGHRKQQGVRVLGAILGAVVGAKVGRNSGELAGAVAGTAVGVGATLLALKFNRNQEMQADRLAVEWMVRAGYNPEGMLRLQQQLGAMAGDKRRAAILSTHPNSAKRYKAAEKQIAQLAPAPELLSRQPQPLVDAETLASAEAAIAQAEADRVAEVARANAPEELPVAALAPIEGISLEAYAALGNELAYAGEAGQARVLSRHKLSEAKLVELNTGFTSRMQEHPGLAQRYSVDYFRASQGKYADWGRDLADSFEKGQALQLEPPLPLQAASTLFLDLQARAAQGLDAAALVAFEQEALRPHQISYYDYLVAHSWWTRKATLAAMSGDTALLQAYMSPPQDREERQRAAAEAAGVHIGDNVHIGEGVTIGKDRDDDD